MEVEAGHGVAPAQREPSDRPPEAADVASELQETRWRLRAVLDNLPAMIGHWDTGLRNTMANQAYVEWFGFTPEQMHGRHIREVLGERLFALNEPYMRRALAGEPQLFERTIVDTNGVTRHTQASYIPDVVEGRVRGFFVLVTDITQRKLAEDALADESERVRTVLDAVTDAVILLDATLVVTDENAAAAPMTGWPPGDAVGQPVADVVRVVEDGHDVPVAALCRDVLSSGRPCRRADRDELLGRDGTSTPVDWLVTPVRSAGGEMQGVVLTLRDVRDSRRLLEEIRHRALHDPLTGTKNRTYLDQLQQRRHADAVLPSAALFLDLDGFKAVNDTAGHAAGDAVLCLVSDELRAAVRASDEIVRMGGDEFAVLLHDCTLEDGRRVGESIVRRVGERVFRWHDVAFRLGVSAGLSMHRPDDGRSVERLLARADEACYRAKRAGGHRVVVEDATPD